MLSFGVLLPTRPRYLEGIPALEAAGYREIWFPDFQLAGGDPFVEMAVQGARTQRMRFGVAVCNPITRHATVVANTMATLNRYHPGRVGLGVGVGEAPMRALGRPPATVAELASFVGACRALMDGESAVVSAQSGPLRFLESARVALNTTDRVPIRVAAGGPRGLRQAGAIADGVILGNCSPRLLSVQIGYVREGARAAGRRPEEVGIAVLVGLFMAEPSPSLDRLRAHVGGYVPNFLLSNRASMIGHEGQLSPALVKACRAVAGLRERAAAAAEAATGHRSAVFESYLESVPEQYDVLVNRDTIEAKVLFGGHDEIQRRLTQLEQLGVDTVVLYPDPLDDGAIEAFARQHLSPAIVWQ